MAEPKIAMKQPLGTPVFCQALFWPRIPQINSSVPVAQPNGTRLARNGQDRLDEITERYGVLKQSLTENRLARHQAPKQKERWWRSNTKQELALPFVSLEGIKSPRQLACGVHLFLSKTCSIKTPPDQIGGSRSRHFRMALGPGRVSRRPSDQRRRLPGHSQAPASSGRSISFGTANPRSTKALYIYICTHTYVYACIHAYLYACMLRVCCVYEYICMYVDMVSGPCSVSKRKWNPLRACSRREIKKKPKRNQKQTAFGFEALGSRAEYT